jgi:hypothetical protein
MSGNRKAVQDQIFRNRNREKPCAFSGTAGSGIQSGKRSTKNKKYNGEKNI